MTVRGERPVAFDWRKWPDTPYRTTPMSHLGEDDAGTWFFAPRGAAASYAAHGPAPLPVSFLTLLPRGEPWWIATWMGDNPAVDIDLYVDIVQPPRRVGDGSVRLVDLDLDVIRRRNGDVLLDDEDEFERHVVTLQYPADVVDAARTTAASMVEVVAARTPPLGDPPARWLAAGAAASG